MYKAIFKLEEKIDPTVLLEEFLGWANSKLNPVYKGNNDWTGVAVYNNSGLNLLDELPRVKALAERSASSTSQELLTSTSLPAPRYTGIVTCMGTSFLRSSSSSAGKYSGTR